MRARVTRVPCPPVRRAERCWAEADEPPARALRGQAEELGRRERGLLEEAEQQCAAAGGLQVEGRGERGQTGPDAATRWPEGGKKPLPRAGHREAAAAVQLRGPRAEGPGSSSEVLDPAQGPPRAMQLSGCRSQGAIPGQHPAEAPHTVQEPHTEAVGSFPKPLHLSRALPRSLGPSLEGKGAGLLARLGANSTHLPQPHLRFFVDKGDSGSLSGQEGP